MKIENPFAANPFYLKHKKVIVAVAFLTMCLALSGSSYVIASYVWGGTISVPTPLANPTSTFTVSATVNGVPQVNPATISLPQGHIGDTYTVIYKITTSANQPITVSGTASPISGITESWSPTSVHLDVDDSPATMTLTLANIQVGGTINVSFSATP